MRELIVTFSESEALDESTIPPVGNFDVYVTRDGDRDDERVSRVEVDATEVILTLARAVRFDDAVELVYDAVRGHKGHSGTKLAISRLASICG